MIIVPRAPPPTVAGNDVRGTAWSTLRSVSVRREVGCRPACAVALLVAALAAAACTSASTAGPSPGPATAAHAVGVLTDTFVDTSRPTPGWGPSPARPSRTLVTTIWYPASGTPGGRPRSGAAPDRRGAPYPLIVFGHGLGATPQLYATLLSAWAAAGYVVAAPLFPLSSSKTPGGPDGGDIGNQPGDMSYVITSVLRADGADEGTLSGLVDPHEIGAAGHSNGAITTLALVANTCCLDPRVKAAVVMAGTTEGLPAGRYVLPEAPPLLLVHGTDDDLVPYRDAVLVFDQALGPKALLTVDGGSHASAAAFAAPSAASVIRATVDFFDAYLRHDPAAVGRLEDDGRPGVTTIDVVPKVGATSTLPVPALPVVHLRASVTPSTDLTDGQTVTVRWSGYTAGKVVNVLECSHVDLSSASSAGCDFSNAAILHADPSGSGSLTVRVATGAVGNGVCGAGHACEIVVNDASSTAPSYSRQLPITFAAG
jgi:fermentation-respiration switch protein FrsA (DUF1100 family)